MQGTTLSMAEIDIGRTVFEYGQIYVALSRIQSLDGLYLLNFHPQKVKANPKVVEFYKLFEHNPIVVEEYQDELENELIIDEPVENSQSTCVMSAIQKIKSYEYVEDRCDNINNNIKKIIIVPTNVNENISTKILKNV
jgi:hypothetical protein